MWFAGRRCAVLSRSLRAARCCAQSDCRGSPSLHLPEGEEPNQPTILAETAADSGNAEKTHENLSLSRLDAASQ